MDISIQRPILQLGILATSRTGREDKFGGLPVGLPTDHWPHCARCSEAMVFLAQFNSSPNLDLKGDGRVLYLFQCPEGWSCEDWEPDSGANRAIILERDMWTGSTTPVPQDTSVEPEALVVGWEEKIHKAGDDAEGGTYVGGEPTWGANHEAYDNPAKGRFLLQLVGGLNFSAPVPTAAATGAQILHYWGGEYGLSNVRIEDPPSEREHMGGWSRGQTNTPGRPSQISCCEDGSWSVEWANFGGGTAYVFMNDADDSAYWFWEK